MRIVRVSDAIEKANELDPCPVAIAGYLAAEGYRWEYEEAKGAWTSSPARTARTSWVTVTPKYRLPEPPGSFRSKGALLDGSGDPGGGKGGSSRLDDMDVVAEEVA